MPPKKVKAKKSSLLAEGEDIHSQYLDAQYNPDLIHSLLQELNKQMESKCNHIQSDADFMITSMQEAFHLELIKLPTQVKKMPLSRFKQEFGSSLEAVTKSAIGGTSAKSISSISAKSHHGRPSMNFQTPITSKHMMSMETPSTRNPREGEMILSANGSPLGVFNTVVKAKNPAASIVPSTPGIFVPLETGDVIDVESVDLDTLPEEVKQEAIVKMQNMMSNMQKLMSKLEGSKY